MDTSILHTFMSRMGAVSVDEPPAMAGLVIVGWPWSPRPQHATAETLADVETSDERGWLRYGLEVALV